MVEILVMRTVIIMMMVESLMVNRMESQKIQDVDP
jgi:hypothetical protein